MRNCNNWPEVAVEAFEAWDKDDDARVGKLLRAMADPEFAKAYREDVACLHKTEAELRASDRLCKIYFKIACGALGEETVLEMRDKALAADALAGVASAYAKPRGV